MNIVTLFGRMTKDPQLSQSGENTIARFTLAVNRRFKKEGPPEADFVSCVAFGKTAENIGKYFTKGKAILISGRLATGSYEKDGQKHYTTDVVIENFDFTESKGNDNNNSAIPTEPTPDFVAVPDNCAEELPFA